MLVRVLIIKKEPENYDTYKGSTPSLAEYSAIRAECSRTMILIKDRHLSTFHFVCIQTMGTMILIKDRHYLR